MWLPLLGLVLPFASGDWYHYRIAIGPAVAGRAKLSIAAPVSSEGRKLLPVRGSAEPEPFFRAFANRSGEIVSWLDPKTLLPVRSEVDRMQKSGRLRVRALQPTPGQVSIEKLGRRTKRSSTIQTKQARPVHDPVSALLWLRTNRLKNGQRTELSVLDGTRVLRVTITGGPVERIELPVGEIRSQVLSGVIRRGRKDHPFKLWLSEDAARIPVRLDARTRSGDARIEITGFGREGAEPSRAGARPASLARRR